MKKLILVLIEAILCLISSSAYAANAAPEPGTDRLAWAVRCCGGMSAAMALCLVTAAVLLIFVVYKRKKEENANE